MAGRRSVAGLVVLGLLVGLWACAQEKEEKMKMSFFVKTTELAKVAFLSRQGPFDGITQAITELGKWVKEHQCTVVGPPIGTFFDDPAKVPPEEARWEIAWAIVEDVKEMEPEEKGGVGIKVLQPIVVATTYHKGSYDKVEATYKALFGWILQNNYEVAGPARELWWSDPQRTPEAQLLSEIQVPVRKR